MFATPHRSNIGPRKIKPLALTQAMVTEQLIDDLERIGIGIDRRDIQRMIDGFGADSLQGLTTTASITTPIQFLQNWLPGFVNIITAARKIDSLIGMMTAGSWEDEEIVQGIMEMTGSATPYTDAGNIPLSSWNVNFDRRTVVRFEEGMQVGKLEEARASRIRVSSSAEKRNAAALALEIERNKVGFNGYNSGNNRTYGFLNDPNLPAYVAVSTKAAGGTTWAVATFLEIQGDIISALQSLRTNSKDTVDPDTMPITMALATAAREQLSRNNVQGTQSVMQWLKETYPNVRVESAPELDAANGGANVFYLYAESIADGSSDGGQTFIQVVPAKFQVLGVEAKAKGYLEDYTNATAGVMCKRPYAVVRRTGI